MFGRERGTPPRIGEYDYGNGRRGRHPIRRNIAPGPPPWVRDATVEPVVGEANEPAFENDAIHGERDRSFESEMAMLEVWD